MEDRYNFNPNQQDIGSGAKDAENGAFEMNGWATDYMNYATVARRVVWTENEGAKRIIEMRPVPAPDPAINSRWKD